MTKTILLVCLLFIGVLIGLEQAKEGIKNVRGEGLELVSIEGEASLSELPSELTIEEKDQMLKEMGSYNLFSDLGKKFASTVTSATELGIDLVGGMLE